VARLLFTLLVLLVACGHGSEATVDANVAASARGVLFINEVMPSNTTACADPFGEYDDWIELYNSGESELVLEGFTLSDDATQPAKARLVDGLVVPAGGFLLLWLDDQVQGIDHFAFKLDAKGEQIALYAPDGTAIDSLAFGEAKTDTSFARIPDGTGEFVTCGVSTCGTLNGTSCADVR
jgi:hypothetical protein